MRAMLETDRPELASDVSRLQHEIDRIGEEQSALLRRTALLGMTAEEASAYKARRIRIVELIRQIEAMKKKH
jgi:hypothetical protein